MADLDRFHDLTPQQRRHLRHVLIEVPSDPWGNLDMLLTDAGMDGMRWRGEQSNGPPSYVDELITSLLEAGEMPRFLTVLLADHAGLGGNTDIMKLIDDLDAKGVGSGPTGPRQDRLHPARCAEIARYLSGHFHLANMDDQETGLTQAALPFRTLSSRGPLVAILRSTQADRPQLFEQRMREEFLAVLARKIGLDDKDAWFGQRREINAVSPEIGSKNKIGTRIATVRRNLLKAINVANAGLPEEIANIEHSDPDRHFVQAVVHIINMGNAAAMVELPIRSRGFTENDAKLLEFVLADWRLIAKETLLFPFVLLFSFVESEGFEDAPDPARGLFGWFAPGRKPAFSEAYAAMTASTGTHIADLEQRSKVTWGHLSAWLSKDAIWRDVPDLIKRERDLFSRTLRGACEHAAFAMGPLQDQLQNFEMDPVEGKDSNDGV